MIEMEKSGVTINWKTVETLMQETYVAQRLAIHSKNNAGELIEDWPFFGKVTVLIVRVLPLCVVLSLLS